MSMENITRFDYSRTHAWWVRFQRMHDGVRKTVSKMFSDGKWGGKYKSRDAAIRWRNANRRKFPKASGCKRGGRRPVPVGYSSHCTFWKTRTRADGSLDTQRILQVRIKVAENKFNTLSVTIGAHGDTESQVLAKRWLRKQRREHGLVAL